MKKTRRSYNSTLPAGKPLKRKGKSRFPKRRQPKYAAWVKSLPCAVAAIECTQINATDPMASWRRDHCRGEVEPAHVKQTRARGAPDVGEIVPLCHHHHLEQEGRTVKFCAKYGIDLVELAESLPVRWREQQGETAP